MSSRVAEKKSANSSEAVVTVRTSESVLRTSMSIRKKNKNIILEKMTHGMGLLPLDLKAVGNFANLGMKGFHVAGVALEHLNGKWNSFFIAEHADDDLHLAAFFVAVITEKGVSTLLLFERCFFFEINELRQNLGGLRY